LRRECPRALEKLIPVKGDVSQPELGLSVEDRTMLMQRVNIVFHSAATVRFDEPIKTAVNLNTRGTDRVVDLCKDMANLVCLVHVSTAYSNADLRDIQEMIYRSAEAYFSLPQLLYYHFFFPQRIQGILLSLLCRLCYFALFQKASFPFLSIVKTYAPPLPPSPPPPTINLSIVL
jgi:hypothetical protein